MQLEQLLHGLVREPPPPFRRDVLEWLYRRRGNPPLLALCDIHAAGGGEHPPAWGLRDDRIPGTDQAVRGGRHGQKLQSGSPPPPGQGDARGGADARSSTDACVS